MTFPQRIAPWCALATSLLALGAVRAEDAGAEDAAGDGTRAIELLARLEPQEVGLGQPFELIIELTRDVGQRVVVPEHIAEGDVALLSPPRRTLEQRGDRVVETIRYQLAAFALKDVQTPEIQLVLADGEPLAVAPLPLRVRRQLDDEALQQGPAEALAPVELERFDERPVAFAILLLLLVTLVLLYRWLDRRRGHSELVPDWTEPELPPDVVALQRLRELERSPLVASGELTRFVDDVVAVLRWYLGRRYGFDALELTSAELEARLSQVLDATLDVTAVQRLLADADLVKFARAPTTTQACAQLVQDVRDLVVATRPVTARQEAAA